jgi:hypothetical protein
MTTAATELAAGILCGFMRLSVDHCRSRLTNNIVVESQVCERLRQVLPPDPVAGRVHRPVRTVND